MIRIATALLVFLATTTTTCADEVRWTFEPDGVAPTFHASATGEAEKRKAEPSPSRGSLHLLQSWWKSTAVASFPATSRSLSGEVDVAWTMVMNTGCEGAGFVWLDVDRHGVEGAAPAVEKWEAPDVEDSFGVGFDAANPPNRDPFRGSGNAYDRPQHEVSLHWNGMELVKKTTPKDFRDEQPHAISVRFVFVTGGAEVTLTIDDATLFDSYFIPSMTAYIGRAAFGARNDVTAGDVLIDDLVVRCGDPVRPPLDPLRVVAIDRKINDKEHKTNEAEVEFPADTAPFGRIVCTLRLDKPKTRFDPWDRIAHIYTYDDQGERFELLRYITPYHRGHVWQVDVTDFRPLLSGRRRIEQVCATYGEGWVVSVIFDFYPGKCDRFAYRVVNLWSGNPEIGNPEKPVDEFYLPLTVDTDPETTGARIRLVVSGHGMHPNTGNAAEFMPIGRTLRVNDQSYHNRLWKEDNYLNPCRPQGGTWKYDRAGWAPGDVVRPWEVDVTDLLKGSEPLKIRYKLDPYVNEGRGESWAPTHTTESQAILYRKP